MSKPFNTKWSSSKP